MSCALIANVIDPLVSELIDQFKDDDIADVLPDWCPFGVEHDTHVTIFYGLPEDAVKNPTIMKSYRDYFSDVNPVKFYAEEIDVFENDDWDCVIIKGDENKSSELITLHEEFKVHFNYEYTHDKYIPHITLGYVKPGLGKKYKMYFNTQYTEILEKIELELKYFSIT